MASNIGRTPVPVRGGDLGAPRRWLAERAHPSSTASGVGCRNSPTALPSARKTTRREYEAATGSWVTMTTVWPNSATQRSSKPRTSAPVRESRLPVGSSANTIAGRLATARAIATRCCWPPDSSLGPV